MFVILLNYLFMSVSKEETAISTTSTHAATTWRSTSPLLVVFLSGRHGHGHRKIWIRANHGRSCSHLAQTVQCGLEVSIEFSPLDGGAWGDYIMKVMD